jgi:electron transport complex protein RnfE
MSQAGFGALMKELTKGFVKENPILVIMLGLCAALACSTSATDAFGMGLAFSFVMLGSNIVVAAIRKGVPSQVRIPVFIVVISTFVTIVDYSLKAYFPSLSQSLGVFVPLIVVNCIVMGRAEAYSSKNTVMASLMDGIGMGIGFTLIITMIGAVREQRDALRVPADAGELSAFPDSHPSAGRVPGHRFSPGAPPEGHDNLLPRVETEVARDAVE